MKNLALEKLGYQVLGHGDKVEDGDSVPRSEMLESGAQWPTLLC